MPGECYVCCRSERRLLSVLLLIRRVGRRHRGVCDHCAAELQAEPRLFWMMAGLELLAVGV